MGNTDVSDELVTMHRTVYRKGDVVEGTLDTLEIKGTLDDFENGVFTIRVQSCETTDDHPEGAVVPRQGETQPVIRSAFLAKFNRIERASE